MVSSAGTPLQPSTHLWSLNTHRTPNASDCPIAHVVLKSPHLLYISRHRRAQVNYLGFDDAALLDPAMSALEAGDREGHPTFLTLVTVGTHQHYRLPSDALCLGSGDDDGDSDGDDNGGDGGDVKVDGRASSDAENGQQRSGSGEHAAAAPTGGASSTATGAATRARSIPRVLHRAWDKAAVARLKSEERSHGRRLAVLRPQQQQEHEEEEQQQQQQQQQELEMEHETKQGAWRQLLARPDGSRQPANSGGDQGTNRRLSSLQASVDRLAGASQRRNAVARAKLEASSAASVSAAAAAAAAAAEAAAAAAAGEPQSNTAAPSRARVRNWKVKTPARFSGEKDTVAESSMYR